MIYLFSPEDSSEMHNMVSLGDVPQLWPSSISWFGAIKTTMWVLLAIVLPLVLITLFF